MSWIRQNIEKFRNMFFDFKLLPTMNDPSLPQGCFLYIQSVFSITAQEKMELRFNEHATGSPQQSARQLCRHNGKFLKFLISYDVLLFIREK